MAAREHIQLACGHRITRPGAVSSVFWLKSEFTDIDIWCPSCHSLKQVIRVFVNTSDTPLF